MTQTQSLLWKEWYEVRLLGAIGLFVFLGLPLIGGAEDLIARHRFVLAASLWVYLLGGVLAVVIGVGTVVRDLNGRLEEFWRSRPVSVTRWLVIKYFIGLAVVLASLIIPLALEIMTSRKPGEMSPNPPGAILAWSPFLWAALYSIAFAVACVVRRGAHAAMLSIAVLLLLYFLPQVLPPLHFLSLAAVMEESLHSRQFAFAAGMIALCALGLIIAVFAVRRDWRVESGRKMMYWSIGGALLILFSSAAFQVATNLPLLQTVDLPSGSYVQILRSDGTNGVVVSRQYQLGRIFVQSFTITASGVQLGTGVQVGPDFGSWMPAWNPRHPDVLYVPDTAPGNRQGVGTLIVCDLNDPAHPGKVHRFPQIAASVSNMVWYGSSFVWEDRLYVLGPKLVTFDVSEPLRPRLVSAEPLNWDPARQQDLKGWALTEGGAEDVEGGTVRLPPVPQLPARQRLDFASREWRHDFHDTGGVLLAGDTLIRVHPDHFTTYHLEQLTETSATFRKAGRYDLTPAQRLLGTPYSAAAEGGLLFINPGNGPLGGAHLAVYDVSGSRVRPIGHFALPQEQGFAPLCPLPDGRLIAAGQSRLYLLGPPPGHVTR